MHMTYLLKKQKYSLAAVDATRLEYSLPRLEDHAQKTALLKFRGKT